MQVCMYACVCASVYVYVCVIGRMAVRKELLLNGERKELKVTKLHFTAT